MREAEQSLPEARHEPTDIGEGFIWGAAALVLAVLIACAILVLWIYPESRLDRTLQLPLPSYPAPRLQPNSQADLQRFRARELEQLNSAGWVDRKEGIVHIPIGEAMRRVAEEGIAGWPAPPAEPP
jgi:hypothetical protein